MAKEREEPITYIPQSVSAAQTLSIETPVVVHVPVTSSLLAGASSKVSNLKRGLSPTAAAATTSSPSSSSSSQGSPLLPISNTSSTQNERPLPPIPVTPPPKKWTFGSPSISTNFATPPPMTPLKIRGGEGRLKVGTASALNTPSRTSSDNVTCVVSPLSFYCYLAQLFCWMFVGLHWHSD